MDFLPKKTDNESMLAPTLIGIFALLVAAVVVGAAVRRHRRESGMETTWSGIKEAFTAESILNVREESAYVNAPGPLDTDLRVGDLLAEAETGSGYIEPRDILARKP